MIDYYVIRNKSTGLYFRGRGENRWGKYFNQASIYRMRANPEKTARRLYRYGEEVEIVPIQIIENATDMVEVVRCKDCKHYDNSEGIFWCKLNSKFYPGGFDWHCFPEDGFCSYGERKDE